MHQDLKQHLEGMESRIVSTLNIHLNEVCENVGMKLRAGFREWRRRDDQTSERKAAGSKE